MKQTKTQLSLLADILSVLQSLDYRLGKMEERQHNDVLDAEKSDPFDEVDLVRPRKPGNKNYNNDSLRGKQ